MKYFSPICCCIVGLTISLNACQVRPSQTYNQQVLRVTTATINESTTVYRHTYVGQIEEQNSIGISSTIAGQIVYVGVHSGEHVSDGQVLFSIDSTQAVNARESALALLHQAEDGYARAYALYKEGGLTEQKRVELESKLAQAQAMASIANRNVENCVIKAPMSGVIGEVSAKVGQTAAPGIPLVTLMNLSGYKVRFSVSENDIAAVETGAKAMMEIPALRRENIELTIIEKSLIPNKISHTYDVTAKMEKMADVLPGMMAKVRMKMDCVTGYILPASCIQVLPDGAKVWIVTDSIVSRRLVHIGQYAADGVLITDGLNAGDKVVTEGYQKLYNGAVVTEE